MADFLTLPGIYQTEDYDECDEAWNIQMILDALEEWDDPSHLYQLMISGADFVKIDDDIERINSPIIFNTLQSSLSWDELSFKTRYHIDRLFILDGEYLLLSFHFIV